MTHKQVMHGVVGFIGFVLSPLTWWNDLFVNIPLAWAFAWLVLQPARAFFTPPLSLFLFTLTFGYLLTNLLGIWMMHHSVKKLFPKHTSRFTRLQAILTSVVPLVVALALFQVPSFADVLVPSWVE